MARMTCDEWIAARTNNPEKLGREKWEKFYNDIKDFVLRGKTFDIDSQLEQKMFGEYLEKNGCDSQDNTYVTLNLLRGCMRNIDVDFEKTLSPQAIKDTVAQMRQIEKNATQTNHTPKPTQNHDRS